MAKKQKLTPDELQERGIPLGESAGPPPDDGTPPPKYGTPKPADPSGPLPRVCSPLERVPAGGDARRYKVRCDSHRPQPTRYVLAKTQADAEACYKATQRLGKEEGVVLAVTELPD